MSDCQLESKLGSGGLGLGLYPKSSVNLFCPETFCYPELHFRLHFELLYTTPYCLLTALTLLRHSRPRLDMHRDSHGRKVLASATQGISAFNCSRFFLHIAYKAAILHRLRIPHLPISNAGNRPSDPLATSRSWF